MSLTGRVLCTAATFVGVQWLVITYADNLTLLLILLAVPDVIAAHVVTRALTVTELGVQRDNQYIALAWNMPDRMVPQPGSPLPKTAYRHSGL